MTEVEDIMSTPVFIVDARDNLAHARHLMLRNGVSRLVVANDQGLQGIVTKKDLGMRLNQSEPQWRRRPLDQVPVGLIMTPDPVTTGPGEQIRAVAQTMLDRDISSLIVKTEEDGVIGIVTKHDLVKYFSLIGSPLRVGDMMSGKPVTVSRLNTINSVMDIMAEHNVDRVVVTDADNEKVCAGIVTLDDIGFVEINPRERNLYKEIRKSSSAGPRKYRTYVELPVVAEDLMATPLISTQQKAMAVEAARLMVENNFDMLPVINDTIVGQFNCEDVMKWLTEGEE